VIEPSKQRYLAEIGIPIWQLRKATIGASDAERAAPLPEQAAPLPGQAAPDLVLARNAAPTRAAELRAGDAEQTWQTLAATVGACTLCALHKTRTQTVFGVGRRDAELFVIGEAPGADEDRQGEPFVGRAGQLLNAMLLAIGLERSTVYIANILKCRPPGNRDPQPAEAAACTPYLQQQIELVRPRAMLAVGRIAAQWLLQSDESIGRLRGKVFHYGADRTPLVITYHPAYLLRSPLAKATAWQDLCMVKELLSQAS
jgi:DNA polymerase